MSNNSHMMTEHTALVTVIFVKVGQRKVDGSRGCCMKQVPGVEKTAHYAFHY